MTDALKFMEELNGPMTVGKLIRAHRSRNELTLEGLSKVIGLAKAYISDLEHDRKSLSLTQTREIADKMGESVELFAKIWIEQRLREAKIDALIDIKPIHKTLTERAKEKHKHAFIKSGLLDKSSRPSKAVAKNAIVRAPIPLKKSHKKTAKKSDKKA